MIRLPTTSNEKRAPLSRRKTEKWQLPINNYYIKQWLKKKQSIGGLVVKSIVAKKRQTFSTLDGPRVRFTVDASLQLLRSISFLTITIGRIAGIYFALLPRSLLLAFFPFPPSSPDTSPDPAIFMTFFLLVLPRLSVDWLKRKSRRTGKNKTEERWERDSRLNRRWEASGSAEMWWKLWYNRCWSAF